MTAEEVLVVSERLAGALTALGRPCTSVETLLDLAEAIECLLEEGGTDVSTNEFEVRNLDDAGVVEVWLLLGEVVYDPGREAGLRESLDPLVRGLTEGRS